MTRLKPLLVLLGAIPTMATLFVVAAPAAHAVATDTTVMIIPPGLGTVNSYNTLTASVTAQDGVTAPVGSIQIRTAAGNVIAAAETKRGATIAEATASIVWYATELTTYGFSAIFYPENPALLNGSETRTNTSVAITPNGQNVQIEVPQIYRGITSELIATTYPSTLQGSVAFTINGSPMSGSITISNGRATFPFVTQSLGWQDIGVSFTLLNNPNVFGVAHSWVNVLPSNGPAPVSFVPALSTIPNGQAQVFELISPAGPINSFTAAGGCIASTLTVTAISGSGDCSLTAIAPWGQGYDGAATTTVLKLEPGRQSANINQSIATTVVGQRVNLITGDNRTNAGIGITWQVVKGAANCIITSGAHFAQVRVLGPCTISGAARKVPGLWAPFEVTQILDPSIRGQSGN